MPVGRGVTERFGGRGRSDDVVVVIDTGLAKEMSFDDGAQASALEAVWIAKANAQQRRGRAGRVQEGSGAHAPRPAGGR